MTFEQALALIEPLHQKKPKDEGLFNLYIDLLEGKEDWQTLLGLLGVIEKRKGLSESEFEMFAAKIVRGALTQKAQSLTFDAAEQQFNQLPNKVKKQDYAIRAYVELLALNGHSEQAQTVLVKALKKSSISEYLPLFRRLRFDNVVEINKYLQNALKKDEADS